MYWWLGGLAGILLGVAAPALIVGKVCEANWTIILADGVDSLEVTLDVCHSFECIFAVATPVSPRIPFVVGTSEVLGDLARA
jgi:hypothetical protein